MPNLSGKVALITGASSGIGAATAIHFASLGASVSLNGRNEENLNKTLEECVKKGLPRDKLLVVLGDVSEETVCESIIQKTVDYFGSLDILINNAGFAKIRPLEYTIATDFDQVIATNLRAPLLLIRNAAPHLKKSKGNVINVSSLLGQCPSVSAFPYAAGKAGLDHMTKCLALELGPSGVRVNCISPGYVDTAIFSKTGMNDEQLQAFKAKVAQGHVLGRMADPIEIAQPIAFLASDEASFITGTVMLADGGYCLKN